MAKSTGIPADQILGRSRRTSVVWVRLACYFITRNRLGWTYEEIAGLMGRDKSAVFRGVKTASDYLDLDRHYQRFWRNLIEPALEPDWTWQV